MFLTTLSIAGSAAFFSVIGLARVFSGAYWSIILMGSSLEAGKLTTASYLYRHWNTMSKIMRGYLVAAVMVLMAITSMGIFGYLSSAFQSNVLPYQEQQQQIELLVNDKTEAEKLKTERLSREDQINKQIANLPDNFVHGRSTLMDANKQELEQIRTDIAEYTEQIRSDTTKIATLKSQVLEETAHIGPIIFIAQVFGADVNQAIKWLIMMIVFAFDPLAVMLTVGTNAAILKWKEDKKPKEVPLPEPTYYPPMPEIPPPAPAPAPEPIVIPTLPDSLFARAHELFSSPNLTEHEKNVAKTLEETIKLHMKTIGKG